MWCVHVDLHSMMWSWWRSGRSSVVWIKCLIESTEYGSGAPKEHGEIRHFTLQVLASLLEDIVVGGNTSAGCYGRTARNAVDGVVRWRRRSAMMTIRVLV